MKRPLTIVMYHYVRDLEHSRFPAIKGLSLERFCRQLDHIQAHYTPVSVEQVLSVVANKGENFPENAILLTFDDGYSDHFLNVFPLLDEKRIQGCFFPPAQAVLQHRVLDVNKIQFVLASTSDPEVLLDRIFCYLQEYRDVDELKSREEYLRSIPGEHRYDPRVVFVIKRLLQHVLPGPIRSQIIQRLFSDYVTADETSFASELYMSVEQIACMRRHGMHIGSHGYAHAWLNHISADEQVMEIDRSLDFLVQFGIKRDDWSMCYPYGGVDESLLGILRSRQCRIGFTVEARIANLAEDNLLLLPRIDTNDLPS